MRAKIGTKFTVIFPEQILNDLSQAQIILGKDKSSLIRLAVDQFLTSQNISEKFNLANEKAQHDGDEHKKELD